MADHELAYDKLINHFGGRRNMDRALAVAYFGERPALPNNWQWDEILDRYLGRDKLLIYLMEEILAALRGKAALNGN
jgi:hypothetical protein